MLSRWISISLAITTVCGLTNRALADVVTFDGLITQSTSDGTGPAANNTSLNNINDGDKYSVTIDFLGSISSTGPHPISLVAMSFNDASAGASETSFSSASVTVSADGSLFDISILGCLSTGSGCTLGNELDANFSIPVVGLNAHGVSAAAIPGLVPSMDLLEDDGVTDIQGSVTGYDYVGSVAPTPEPSELVPVSAAIVAIVWSQFRRRKKEKHTYE
jgi:hypothetical protein